MNIQEYDLMNCIMEQEYVNQRILSEITGYSLGKVNSSLKKLTELGYLDEKMQCTPKVYEELEDKAELILHKMERPVSLSKDRFTPAKAEVTSNLTKEQYEANVKKAKEVHPEAEVLVHPECTPDVVALGDYVGSTSGIIDYATASDKDVFIICTEMGVLYELKQKNPGKTFYSVGHRQFCPNMKRISLENVRDTLRDMKNQVELPEELRLNAKKALDEMLRIAQ